METDFEEQTVRLGDVTQEVAKIQQKVSNMEQASPCYGLSSMELGTSRTTVPETPYSSEGDVLVPNT